MHARAQRGKSMKKVPVILATYKIVPKLFLCFFYFIAENVLFTCSGIQGVIFNSTLRRLVALMCTTHLVQAKQVLMHLKGLTGPDASARALRVLGLAII